MIQMLKEYYFKERSDFQICYHTSILFLLNNLCKLNRKLYVKKQLKCLKARMYYYNLIIPISVPDYISKSMNMKNKSLR